VATARRALGLAAEQRNQELEAALRADLDHYEALAQGVHAPGPAGQPH
jgi:hypothetical protein